ncbi:MAG: response regulator [Muribaculaceae bacterium]|nr:response regulator [Muribaculaceae bacterium]
MIISNQNTQGSTEAARRMRLAIAMLVALLVLPATVGCHDKKTARSSILNDADSTLEHAYVLYDEAKYQQSLNLARMAKGIYERHDDQAMVSDCYSHIAACFQRLGDVDSGITNTIKGMEIEEKLGDNERLSSTYNNLAGLYLTAGRPEEALAFIDKAIEIERGFNNSPRLSIRYGIAAEIHLKLLNLDSALNYITMAHELDTRAGDSVKIARRLSVMGDIYSKMNRKADAESAYRQSIALLEQNGEITSRMITCQHLASLLIDEGKNREAVELLTTSTRLSENTGAKLVRMKNYESLAKALKHDNPALAIDYMTRSNNLKDSINRQETSELTAKYAAQFRSQQQELTIARQQRQIQRQYFFIAGALALAAVLLAAVVALFYFLRYRARSQRILQRVSKERQDFLTSLTNEFRQPLTVIIGQSQALQQQEKNPARQEQLEAIARQGQSVLSLVNQMINVSNINRHRANWYHDNVVTLVEMTIENARTMAHPRHVTIDFVAERSTIEMDFIPYYIDNLVSGVLYNAINLSDRGERIVTTLRRLDDKVIFSAITAAADIDNERLDNLFHSLERELRHRRGDNGKELSLVRHLVETMNGEIEVINLKDKGTAFNVIFPAIHTTGGYPRWVPDAIIPDEPIEIAPTDAKPTFSAEEQALPAVNAEQPIALIVDDNQDIARFIDSLLRPRFQTIITGNGAQALGAAAEFKPDIVLTDTVMPQMDGIELCRAMRGDDALRLIPIIVFTATGDNDTRISALHCGADAVVNKPFDARELIAIVTNLLQQRAFLRTNLENAIGGDNSVGNTIAEGTKADSEWVKELNNTIMANIADPELGSIMLADKMCLSQRQLNRKVKALTGYDTSTYIRESRISLAKRLLAATDQPINEIVVKCGFDSPSYFAKIFKQVVNLTPSDYRRSQQPL